MIRALFVHHSVGRIILSHGVRASLKHEGIMLWDVDYNKIGTKNDEGSRIDALKLPGDKTNPEDFVNLFNMNTDDKYKFVKWMQTFDVVILKSCYIALKIKTEKQLANRLISVNKMFEIVSKTFGNTLIITPPPLSRLSSSLYPIEYQKKIITRYNDNIERQNVAVCDLYELLTGGNNHFLHPKYQRIIPIDSHPNDTGADAAAKFLAQAIVNSCRRLI